MDNITDIIINNTESINDTKEDNIIEDNIIDQ